MNQAIFASFAFTLVFAIALPCALNAQDESIRQLKNESGREIKKDPADTLPQSWRKGGLAGLNISQGSLNNWAAGGEDFSFSANANLNLFAFYKKEKRSWDNTLDFNFGYVNTTSLGSRKNDDRFDLLSKYGYAIAPKWNVAGLFNFRSQLFKGYTYPEGEKVFSSAFLSPGYLLLSAGLDFKPNDKLSVFLSPAAMRWVIVLDDTLSAQGAYGVDPGEHVKNEFGAFASVNYMTALSKIISYKGKLDLFSNYRHNPGNIDLFMSNIFSASLGKYLTANWSLDFIYDDDVKIFGDSGSSPALQVKSLIGVGLQAKF